MELILFLLIAGIVLLFVEVYLTPGASVFGGLGVIALIASNYYAFTTLDGVFPWIFLGLSVLITSIFLFLFWKIINSKKFSVQTAILSKANTIEIDKFLEGEIGKTLTTLRPNGRAEFNDGVVEVFSNGEYIEDHKDIIIYKRTNDKIFVKLI